MNTHKSHEHYLQIMEIIMDHVDIVHASTSYYHSYAVINNLVDNYFRASQLMAPLSESELKEDNWYWSDINKWGICHTREHGMDNQLYIYFIDCAPVPVSLYFRNTTAHLYTNSNTTPPLSPSRKECYDALYTIQSTVVDKLTDGAASPQTLSQFIPTVCEELRQLIDDYFANPEILYDKLFNNQYYWCDGIGYCLYKNKHVAHPNRMETSLDTCIRCGYKFYRYRPN